MEYTIAGTLYRTREGAVAALASLILPDPEVMGDAPYERRAGGVRGRAADLVAEWERGGAVHADLRAMLLDTLTRRIMDAALRWRAYDVVTEWSGPPRADLEQAAKDAEEHNAGCAAQGGYGSATVAERGDGDRLWDAYSGEAIWPPHGRSCGAARWLS